jgi:hypothetical protein
LLWAVSPAKLWTRFVEFSGIERLPNCHAMLRIQKQKKSDEQFSPEETARRDDTLLFQLLKTPPRPRDELKAKPNRKPSRAKTASRKRRKTARSPQISC